MSVKAFDIFSQGRDLESCGDFSWEHFLEESEDLSGREPVSCELVRVVPDVIDVLVSLRLWSLSCVMFLPVAMIGNLWNRSPFLSPKSAHIVVQTRRKR